MSELEREGPIADLAPAERFQLLLAAVKDYAIFLLDAEGKVATWNTGAQLYKGYDADEILGRHFSIFYTPEDRQAGRPAQALRTAAEQGRFEAEGWRVRKNGQRFWAHVVIDPVRDEAGRLIGFAKITRDVSEKRSADQALRQSEQRFGLLVQGVRDYAIYMLDPEGIVTNWNAGAEAIKGYAADEIVGRNFAAFYTPEDQARGAPQAALQAALRDGKYEAEVQRVRKSGERFWAQVLIDPIRDEGGQLIGFAKVTRDVTEQRRAQEEIERGREALAQAQKMEAIGRLTGGVAHDFNNLLTVIRASAEMLARPDLDDAKRARYVEAIATTAERAATLTGQLLAFARRQPLTPEVFDVCQRIDALSALMTTSVGSRIKLQIDPSDERLFVAADPTQFDNALLNIVINARDAMPAGGEIKLAVRAVDGVPAVRNHPPLIGSFVAVSVADGGVGIAPDTLERIFEPFFTTKGVGKGTGLGLSQAYGFAKQSGGEIAVTSTVGEGTTFTFYLPRRGGVDQADDPAAARSPLRAAARRVLLVEDNSAVGEFAADLLTELGQDVTWASDGQQALEYLEAGDGAFDLMFTDVVMPGVSGVDLARQVRERWPHIHIVLTSGYSHVIVEEGTYGFELVRKPYTASALLEVLKGLDG